MSVIEATSSIASAWDRYAVTYQNAARLGTDVIGYGPGAGVDTDYRLVGSISGKRVIDLGCGGGQNSIAFAKMGAVSIGIDISVEQLAYARRLIEQEEVRVELKHGDLAEMAFQRADTIDVAFSAMAFQYVPDLSRVFRQVHRVLKPQGAWIFSIPHPAAALTGQPSTVIRAGKQLSIEPTATVIERSYFDRSPLEDTFENLVFTEYHRPISDIFMGLTRTGYRVDVILEPELENDSIVPKVLIIRARKES